MMEGFRKIDYRSLQLNNTRRLYRAVRQSWFERDTLRTSLKYGRPSYSTHIEPGDHTFATPDCIDIFTYAGLFSVKIEREAPPTPLSHNIIIIAIQADCYQDRLTEHPDGFPEGIAIEGPIDLADISVMFSNRVDRFDDEFVKSSLGAFPDFYQLRKFFFLKKEYADLPTHNPGLVEAFRSNRETTTQKTLRRLQSHFTNFYPNSVDFEKYLEALVSLLEE